MAASRAFDERGQSCGWPAEALVPRQRGVRRDVHVCSHYQNLQMVQRDLHDQVGSSLAGMTMTIDVARRSLASDSAEADRVLIELRTDVTKLIAYVRQLLATNDAQPHGGSVAVALHSMIGGMSRAVADRMVITLDVDPRIGTVDDDIAWAAFWIVREAMTNVLKHSSARHCAVRVTVRGDELHVRVQDDGVGLGGARGGHGAGLANMTSRATDHGGWCAIEPLRPGGVAVTAWFPLHATAALPKELR
ncbi:MAG TPA: ATP-binding protein [Pseudonocardiaceae bacterium]|jgi:signal transduction histidine kinase|nr:ATP-binding protein [Pseudonocardiaceae bacterium]